MNKERVINYKNNYIDSEEGDTKDKIIKNKVNDKEIITNQKRKKILYIVLPILGTLIIGGVIALIIKLTHKTPPPEISIETDTINKDIHTDREENDYIEPALGPLEMQTEYKIKTEEGDLKSIYINQRYYEDIKIDGAFSQNLVDRKTNYQIFIMKETEANKEESYFFNKTYLCAISISSECVSTSDEYCLPKKLVDLNDQDYSHVRNLDEIDSFENFPLPLCLFNLTDNNVITSITCHKNLSESKINSIVLDLYFFRPPGIKRIDKEKGNITITERKEGNNQIIRETNGGLCDVDNAMSSFCTTDMNTTKDSEGNLVSYDEEAFTNITTDENNYYLKTKITKLLDKTTSELNPQKFNETFNKIYPNLKDYMKYYERFSLDNFKELYNVSKGLPTKTKSENNLRRLDGQKPIIVNGETLFKFTHFGGINILISLKDNSGYNTEAMEAYNILEIDDKIVELAKIKEFSDIDKVLNKLISLSRAGNNLATTLYKKIKEGLNNITDIITINIPIINELVVYKELSDIFDSTFSLNSLKRIPIQIMEESNNLINKLDKLYSGIEDGSLKNNIRVLNDYIYKFIKQSHILVNKISNNLKELGDLIKSPKQTISDISTYYLNHTSTSYINTIQEAQQILMNYYINEKELIIPEVETILKQFEDITIESIQKQINLVNNLTSKLEDGNLTVNNASENDFKKIIVNLQNSNNYINNIINLFKNKVRNEMDLKDDYFISKYDIESNNETFIRIIEESLIIAQKLDDNEYIDKTFDNMMTNFRQSFISNTKYMDELKEENFPMDENTLKGGYFKSSEQQKISKELKELSVNVINFIQNENNEYYNTIKEKVSKFLNENRDNLNYLIRELNFIFSEEKLEEIAKLYNTAFTGHLNQVTNVIEEDNKLTKNYFDSLKNVITNNNELINYLKAYPVDKSLPPGHPCVDPKHCWQYTKYEDIIYAKYKTQFYINKYNIFKAKYENAKDFINEELQTNVLEEYKNIITNLKGLLQTFKNNKMSDKYPDYTDLSFIDEHIKDVDILYNRLNKYISDDIYNNNYLPKIKNYKLSQNNGINNIINYIETQHKTINSFGTINDFKNDFCFTYKRRKTYTCTNSAVYEYDESSKSLCYQSSGSDNYNKLILPSFTSDNTLKNEFVTLYSSTKNLIESYNEKINELKLIFSSIETEILNKNKDVNYLSPIADKVNSILSEKYSDNIIQSTYNYYKKLLDERLDNMFFNISDKWINSYDTLGINVNNSLNDFKNSINEFGLMALIYEAVISQNLTRFFYDSIIEHQKSEFNYTISYYYNCLIQNVTSIYQYIFNQIPTNEEGFNNIIDLRKKEVNDIFNEIFNIIKQSKEEAKSINKQTNVLQVSSTNFFNTGTILSKNVRNLGTTLKSKGQTIYKTKNGKQNNEFSLACRFYLENSINGWQIEELYQPIDDNIFVSLNLKKFKEILSNNWIFDQDEFINKLNLSIYNTNLEIKNAYQEKIENYTDILEEKITRFITKDSLIKDIKEQYESQIKTIDKNMVKNIKQNIQNILNEIKKHLSDENERLKISATSFTNDFSKINKTIQNYKENILNKLNDTLKQIVDDFYENMINVFYIDYIDSGLNKYINESDKYIPTCETYSSFLSDYNIGLIINNIIQNLVIEYKNLTKFQIERKKDEYIKKLNQESELNEIQKLIDDELNPEFSNLLNILKNIAKNNPGETDYFDYDLSDEIKNQIDSKIDENYGNIAEIISKIKGDEYNVKIKGNVMDYEGEDVYTFNPIKKDFELFIKKKIESEEKDINKFLKEIIRKNFNNLINNLILSFGNEFFERVIKYNENFKITSLYQNLKYSLVVSLQYYANLYGLRKNINSLTQDLKIKLYNLNNLDLIAEQKNKKVLNLLNNKADEFIEESMRHILSDYKLFLKTDSSIKLSFNDSIINSIANNFEDIISDLEKDYKALLNEQFKKKLLNSYSKVMNEQTNDMIQTVNNLKQNMKSMFDDLFSLDIEEVLYETNMKMNITLDSINEYKTHFDSFKIPEELIQFFEIYGDNTIQPVYQGLETLINKETKNLTLKYLQQNSKNYENKYNNSEFINKKEMTYSLIKDEGIDFIFNEINLYGKSENEYKNASQNEINQIERRNLRRLNGEETEKDISEEYKEKVADKSVDENFYKLLNSSKNTIKFVETYEYFDKFIEKIEKYVKKLNISYKDSENTIDNIYKDDDIYSTLNDKLQFLYNLSINYYNDIKGNYNSLRKYIEESLNEINNLLNVCANITYKTFADKYEEISNDSEAIDKEQDKIDENINKIEHSSISQNSEYITVADITSIIKKARFKFSLSTEEEGNIKKPKVKASVINQMRPKSINFEIYSPFGNCGRNIQKVEVEFNNVSYSTNLNMDTKSTLINVTTVTDFETYQYTIGRYKVEDSNNNLCNAILGISLCIEDECDINNPITIEAPIQKTKNRFTKEETISIEG